MIPCKDCLLIPVCRCKDYSDMTRQCDLIAVHLYEERPISPYRRKHQVFNVDIWKIELIIRPLKWKVTMRGGVIELVDQNEKIPRISDKEGDLIVK